jgi:hypothetical protein
MSAARYRVDTVSADAAIVHNASTYVRKGCRCHVCRAANTARHAWLKAGRYEYAARHGVPGNVEHGRSAYDNWGCRCTVCFAAKSAANRYNYDRRRAAA